VLLDAVISVSNSAREITHDSRQCPTLVAYSPPRGEREPIFAAIARNSCVSTPLMQRRRDTKAPHRRTNQ
jgi:hypothetical protein